MVAYTQDPSKIHPGPGSRAEEPYARSPVVTTTNKDKSKMYFAPKAYKPIAKTAAIIKDPSRIHPGPGSRSEDPIVKSNANPNCKDPSRINPGPGSRADQPFRKSPSPPTITITKDETYKSKSTTPARAYKPVMKSDVLISFKDPSKINPGPGSRAEEPFMKILMFPALRDPSKINPGPGSRAEDPVIIKSRDLPTAKGNSKLNPTSPRSYKPFVRATTHPTARDPSRIHPGPGSRVDEPFSLVSPRWASQERQLGMRSFALRDPSKIHPGPGSRAEDPFVRKALAQRNSKFAPRTRKASCCSSGLGYMAHSR